MTTLLGERKVCQGEWRPPLAAECQNTVYMSPVWTAGVEWALPDHNGKQDGHNDGGEREIQARQSGEREGDTGETDQGEGRRYRRERPEKRGVLVV